MGVVIVAGALANKVGNGGGAWERLSWVTGLRRLGADVYFVEQIAPAACLDAEGAVVEFETSRNVAWFRATTEWFGVADRSVLVLGEGGRCIGMPWEQLLDLTASADLLLNISGHLTAEPLLRRIRRKAYIDVDPGFTQIWHADPATPFTLPAHDFYFTIGENIGSPDCAIPTSGIRWRPTRQPVVLDDWPVTPTDAPHRFTTVASWRGAFGPVTFQGQTYGLKVHEFRRILQLPRLVGGPTHDRAKFEIALDIHPKDHNDRAALEANGWSLTDPRIAAGDWAAFQAYIQQSGAEFSVAQGIYVDTNSGWFSDRTVRYLASGKPALVQDTGFTRNYGAGLGLVAFRTLEEAAAGVRHVLANYEEHCRAARSVAETYFDSDKVLGRLLDDVGD
jgi:hypothetical protein